MDEDTKYSVPTGSRRLTRSELEISVQADLIEPQFYPDPLLFRASLERLIKDTQDWKKTLTGSKAALRSLAPYLQIFYRDQKKKIAGAHKHKAAPRSAKLPLSKTSGRVISVVPNILKHLELIQSVFETANILKSIIKVDKLVTYFVDPTKDEIIMFLGKEINFNSVKRFKIEQGTILAAYVAQTKQHIMSNNILSDQRFPMGAAMQDPYTKFALCVPIKTPDDHVVAVYELIRDGFHEGFEKQDLQTVLALTAWIGSAVLQYCAYTKVKRQEYISNHLQQLTLTYSCENANLDQAFSDFAVFARETIRADRCALYVVLDADQNYLELQRYEESVEDPRILVKVAKKLYIKIGSSYLTKVLVDKQLINITVKTENTTFGSILCAPVLCSCNEALAAIQVANSNSAANFNGDDEETIRTFSNYLAIIFQHEKMTKSVKSYNVQGKLIKDMLRHHIQPCIHAKEIIKNSKMVVPDDFFTFSWYPAPDDMPRLAELTLSLFHEVLGSTFMELNNVPRFVLTVRKCYRKEPYHSFLHAFSVAHTMANIITRNHNIFTGLERRALMVAALCHDVDHRGYNNNFIQLTKHYLSGLYESSYLENHHFVVTKMICDLCNMFSYIKDEYFEQLMQELHDCILATDLSLYFQCRIELLKAAEERTFSLKDPNHRRLVKSLMMTTCDLCGQTKPMDICKKVTDDVYEEFFRQGDLEKKLGFKPIPTMDRDKGDMIVDNQVQFLSFVVLPCVETVSRIFSSLQPMVESTRDLLTQWRELANQEKNERGTFDEKNVLVRFKRLLSFQHGSKTSTK